MRSFKAALMFLIVAFNAGCGATSPPGRETLGPSGSGGASASAAAVPTAQGLIGSWTTTITDEDIRAAGFTEQGLIDENSGLFTTTFAEDGTWTTAQQVDPPPRWPVFRGTWTTSADQVEMTTTFPPDYAGDVVTAGWRVDGELLHFRLVTPEDPILRMNLESHPWQRSR